MLQKKPGHDPVAYTINVFQELLGYLKDGYSVVEAKNGYPGLLFEDARILFREYSGRFCKNKWDGFVAERIEVMDLINRAQKLVFCTDIEKEMSLIIEGTIDSIMFGTWDEGLPEQKDVVLFLSFVVEDLRSFHSIRTRQQHTA